MGCRIRLTMDTPSYEPTTEFEYYHALYHLVYHWAANVAALALLITIGIVLSTGCAQVMRFWPRGLFCLTAIVITLLASWFFLWRMKQFGSKVNQYLSKGSYISGTYVKWCPPPWNLRAGWVVAFAVAVLDGCVLFG